MLLERYKVKTLKLLNDSLDWNIAKLPNNTMELQCKKVLEEIDEALEAKDNYEHFVEEIGDIFIAVGGLARFNREFSADVFSEVCKALDKFIFMDAIDQAEKKIPVLYERDYTNGYHHNEEKR